MATGGANARPRAQEYCPCKADVFEALPAKLAPGGGPSDHYWALVAACDLLVRTATDRKLQSARKSIVVVSPFAAPVPAVGEPLLVRPTTARVSPSLPV